MELNEINLHQQLLRIAKENKITIRQVKAIYSSPFRFILDMTSNMVKNKEYKRKCFYIPKIGRIYINERQFNCRINKKEIKTYNRLNNDEHKRKVNRRKG